MTANSVNGIVKMVPKGYEMLENLDNWRNLTMLTTMYKIVSKILIEGLKPIVPNLVEPLQMGFMTGRCIIDNSLTWKLEQEHAHATRRISFVWNWILLRLMIELIIAFCGRLYGL